MVRSAAMTDSFASFDLTLGVGAKLGALSRDESDSSRAGRSCGPKVGSFRETVCSFQIAMARTPIQSGALTTCDPLKCLGLILSDGYGQDCRPKTSWPIATRV